MDKKWFATVIATVILVGSAFADENTPIRATPNLDKGTKVLEGGGYANFMADDLQIQLAYGQFVADGAEVAIVAGLRDNDAYMSTELGARAEYNFRHDSAFVPFLGAGAVWADAEADESGLDSAAALFSLGGGLKYFLRNDVALAAGLSYLAATDDVFVDSEDQEVQDDDVRLLFSIRYYFD